MIIRNGFNPNKNAFNKNNQDYLNEEKIGLRRSIDNLDTRYKNGEINIDKFKKIADNYATQQEDLNKRINNHR